VDRNYLEQPTQGMLAMTDQLAEWEFRQRDINGDGLLNTDEMEGRLRNDLDYWDGNGDNLIDIFEFKTYFRWKMGQRLSWSTARAAEAAKAAANITWGFEPPPDSVLEKLPTVFRAGKLPPGLPEWFAELDTDGDGQVGLYEWRKAGKSIDEFQAMDRNGDGLLTAEEMLYYMDQVARNADNATLAEGTAAAPDTKKGKMDFGGKGKKNGKDKWNQQRR